MKVLSDTRPEAEQVLINGYRRMSVADRFQRVRELNQLLEAMALADVRRRHPEATEEEARLYVASRRIPPALMRKAFGWHSDEKGY